MKFCDECGGFLPANEASGECDQCGEAFKRSKGESGKPEENADQSPNTELEQLPTTGSGSVKKADAMEWLENLDCPSASELRRATIEKPSDFTGSTFPTDISTIRLTGHAEFIETVAGLFSWIVEMEDYSRRVEINLKETEDKETGEQTGNYALYLSVADRG
jgi:DNA-directed RNA polymerase subunit M/transcription elongation factor TFIIS